jgi:hypothetical protein
VECLGNDPSGSWTRDLQSHLAPYETTTPFIFKIDILIFQIQLKHQLEFDVLIF